MTVKSPEKILIFTSYAAENETDFKRLKIHLLPSIQRNEVQLWNFRDDTSPGNAREQEIAERLQSAQIILLLLSPDYLYDTECMDQMQRALERFSREAEQVCVIPIQLRPCNLDMVDLKGLLVLPRNGSPIKKWPDPDEAMLQVADEISNVVKRIRTVKSTSETKEIPDSLPVELINPYVGLQPFNFRNANHFFGRKELERQILDELQSVVRDRGIHNEGSSLLAIIGPSGAGKSSLIHAGVLPALTQGALPGSSSWLILNTVYPGSDPFVKTANVLLPHLPSLPAEWLEKSKDGLIILANSILQTHRQQPVEHIVLVIDQFEDIFTQTTDEQRRKFIQLLTTAAREENGPLIILLLLRADFYGQLMETAAYSELFHLTDKHCVKVFTLSEEGQRAAIVEPAELLDVQVTFEPGMVDLLLEDMRGQNNSLPWLQYILWRLFEESTDRHITKAVYERIGRLEGTIAQYADKVYLEELPSDEHCEAARRLFFALSAISDTDHTVIARHRVARSDVERIMGEDKRHVVQKTIDILLKQRLLSADLDTAPHTDDLLTFNRQILDISHEALLREWPRFQEWIKLHQDSLLACQRIDMDITRWEQKDRSPIWLYRDHNLQELVELNKSGFLNGRRQLFLQASLQESRYKRRQQNLRNSLRIFIALVLIGTLAAGYILRPFTPLPPTTVWSTSDSGPGSLRQVIHDAPSKQTIYFAPNLAGQTITLQSDLNLDKNITISGINAPNITIKGTPPGHLYGYKISIAGETDVTFENLAFTGGFVHQDGFIYNQGSLTLTHCKIYKNRSDYNGGALVNAGGLMILNSTEVHENSSNGNGGAIYNWNGSTVITNSSNIHDNTSLHNGGGIYSLRGSVDIINSLIMSNGATSTDSNSYFGGGVDLQNAEFSLINSTVALNHANGNGGGLAVQGGNALIDNSTIVRNYVDNGRGGGLIAVTDSENNRTAQIIITHTEINDDPKTDSFIGSNTYNKTDPNADAGDTNISGLITSESNRFIVTSKSATIITGNPPPSKPSAEQNPAIYLGPVDIDKFCQSHNYSFGNPSKEDSSQIRCLVSYHNDTNIQLYPAVEACQWFYPPKQGDIITRKDGTKDRKDGVLMDRLADYYDPSSLQCYHNVRMINYNITDPGALNYFCSHFAHYQGGLNNNERKTAYDWKCKDTLRKSTSDPSQFVSVGISVTDACRDLTGDANAFDRLSNFNRPDGWECWTQN